MTTTPPSDSDSRLAQFRPTASLAMLRLRGRLLAAVRRYFEALGYWEVETPILSNDIVVDAHLEPFVTQWHPDADTRRPRPARPLYMQTSPEFGMKRLLATGADAIYQIARVMRNGERGHHHNPEFTMIEWYRTGETHREQMAVVEGLVRAVCAECGVRSAECGIEDKEGMPFDSALRTPHSAFRIPFRRLTYDEAFESLAGTRVLTLSCAELAGVARRHGVVPPPGLEADDRDGWLNFLLAELVEPHLGRERPTFLYDYPASQAALARVRPDDPPVAERFELYFGGVELCNGYHELTDPDELRRRMKEQAALRARNGYAPLPLDNRLLDAMEAGLPPCAGVALGFDRLMMLAVGASAIDEVIAFPLERA